MKKIMFIFGILFCLARQAQAQTVWQYTPDCNIHRTACDIEVVQYWDNYYGWNYKYIHHPRYTNTGYMIVNPVRPIISIGIGFGLGVGYYNNGYYSQPRCYPKPRPIHFHRHY